MPHVHKWISAFQRILFWFFLGWMSAGSPGELHAQVVDGVYASPGRGFVIPHRPELRGLVTAHSTILFVGVWKDTRNAAQPKRWHSLYRYPRWGFEAYYSGLGNPRQLGHQFAGLTYLQVPSKRLSGRRVTSSALWGIGLGYTTEVWDNGNNPKGIALSSHLNICLAAGYATEVQISERMAIEGGLRFTHFSNGALKRPNLGTNNLSAQIGVRYRLQPESHAPTEELQFTSELPVLNEVRAVVGIGMKQNLPPGGPNYLVHNLAGEYTRRFGWKHGILVRADAWYNTAAAALIDGETGAIDRFQAGFTIGYRRHFGAASFDVQMGAYAFTRFKGNGMIYHRFQINHRLSERLRASVGLTAHWARAHHPEVGLGYRF